jgi:hypothetical protein
MLALALRSLDPARSSSDRRVAFALGYGLLGFGTLFAVLAGAGGWAIAAGGVVALAGAPWLLAFGGRWRLLDDALAGVRFAWRGDRAGVWATAPLAGALATLFALAALGGVSTGWGIVLCLLGAGLYTWLLASTERRYERLVCLDLVVLELRFERITASRSAVEHPHGLAA